MKKRNLLVTVAFAATVALFGGLLPSGCTGPTDSTQQVEILTEPFLEVADGDLPPAPHTLRFPSFEQPRLLWITAIHLELIGADGSPAATLPAFRTDVGFDYMRHARIHQLPVYHTDRLFTLTGTQTAVVFPDGFGLPFFSDEELTLTARPLNPVQSSGATGVRQRVVLEFVFDRDLDEPMKPLFATSGRWIRQAHGGRERILRLPFDTQAHYITAPLRSRAGSVELRDQTTGETVYDSTRDGGEATLNAAYSSGEEGIALFENRSYVLIDDHDDPETNANAPMLLYPRDKLFKKRPRQAAPVAHFDEPVKTSDERLLLVTNHGQIEIAFYPEVAPRHYKQIIKLARLGVYDGVKFHRVEPEFLVQLGFPENRVGPPLTTEQSAALRRLEAEFSDLPMKRWTVAMALHDNADPDSAVASFFILLETTRRIDQQYTIVGRVFAGLGTLNAIANLPQQDGTPLEPVFIEQAKVKTLVVIDADRSDRLKRSGPSRGE